MVKSACFLFGALKNQIRSILKHSEIIHRSHWVDFYVDSKELILQKNKNIWKLALHFILASANKFK